MISRATSLQGLLILRPFNAEKFCCRCSEDTRHENRRISILNLQTQVIHSTAMESAAAQAQLSVIGNGINLNELEGTDDTALTDKQDDNVILLQRIQSSTSKPINSKCDPTCIGKHMHLDQSGRDLTPNMQNCHHDKNAKLTEPLTLIVQQILLNGGRVLEVLSGCKKCIVVVVVCEYMWESLFI
jgi:hypothetical protein